MVKVEKYMNLIFILGPPPSIPIVWSVKSWINSIHLFKSVYYLMTHPPSHLCPHTQIKILLISTLLNLEHPLPHPTHTKYLWQFK